MMKLLGKFTRNLLLRRIHVMKKPDLTKYKTTSTLYLLILIIAAVALIFGWRCTSSSLSNRSADLHIRTLPSRCVKVSKTTTVYRISDVRWTKRLLP